MFARMQAVVYGSSFFKGQHAAMQKLLKKANLMREAEQKPPRSDDLKTAPFYKSAYEKCSDKFSVKCVSGSCAVSASCLRRGHPPALASRLVCHPSSMPRAQHHANVQGEGAAARGRRSKRQHAAARVQVRHDAT